MNEQAAPAPKSDTVRTPMLLTTAEAIALVKRSERERARWVLHVRLDAAIIDKPDHVFPDGLGHYLDLSRAGALALVSKMLSEALEARGARITITKCEYAGYHGKARMAYWTG